jgi:hypothetical protein
MVRLVDLDWWVSLTVWLFWHLSYVDFYEIRPFLSSQEHSGIVKSNRDITDISIPVRDIDLRNNFAIDDVDNIDVVCQWLYDTFLVPFLAVHVYGHPVLILNLRELTVVLNFLLWVSFFDLGNLEEAHVSTHAWWLKPFLVWGYAQRWNFTGVSSSVLGYNFVLFNVHLSDFVKVWSVEEILWVWRGDYGDLLWVDRVNFEE